MTNITKNHTEKSPTTAGTFGQTIHNPDVLLCIANLSSDEVLSSPDLANRMLNLLPAEIWNDPNATFLDPACKEGIFGREITRRLHAGLAQIIPDPKERARHILNKQVFGLATSELTAQMSRRSVYGNKKANSHLTMDGALPHLMDTQNGHIRFPIVKHNFNNQGKCTLCGFVTKYPHNNLEKTNHAYPFIHLSLEEIQSLEGFPMQFDVIIGNPPYQLSDGGFGASASPIYQKFVESAIALNPKHLIMITPSRWFAGGKGLDEFRARMLADHRIQELVDYPNPKDVFPGISISGGVSFFHWNAQYDGPCQVSTVSGYGEHETRNTATRFLDGFGDTFVRWNSAVSILEKVADVRKKHGWGTMDAKVSSSKPFGLRTNIKPKKKGDIDFYANKSAGRMNRKDLLSGHDWVDCWKVLAPAAFGGGEDYPHFVTGTPFVVAPGSACSETYNVIGAFHPNQDKNAEIKARRLAIYYATRFFRFLVLQLKNSQHVPKDRYAFVPDLPMDRDWTDTELFNLFGLSEEERQTVQNMVRERQVGTALSVQTEADTEVDQDEAE